MKTLLNGSRVWCAAVMALLLLAGAPAQADEEDGSGPVSILYVTSVGWFHDYEAQTLQVIEAVGSRLRSEFDVIVGDVPRLLETDFWAGHDLLIYNFCHASRRDPALVDRLIAPVRDHGIPLLAVHCSMHSFQHVAAWHDFLGLKTLRHEEQRSFSLQREGQHPVTAALEFPWQLASDELYITLDFASDSRALMTAYGVETERDHVQAWIHPVAGTPVLATTLGHSEDTLSDPQFGSFLARASAFLTARMTPAGEIPAELACAAGCEPAARILTSDVRYPTAAERACVLKALFASEDPWPAPEDLWPACRQ